MPHLDTYDPCSYISIAHCFYIITNKYLVTVLYITLSVSSLISPRTTALVLLFTQNIFGSLLLHTVSVEQFCHVIL